MVSEEALEAWRSAGVDVQMHLHVEFNSILLANLFDSQSDLITRQIMQAFETQITQGPADAPVAAPGLPDTAAPDTSGSIQSAGLA